MQRTHELYLLNLIALYFALLCHCHNCYSLLFYNFIFISALQSSIISRRFYKLLYDYF